MLSAGRRHGLTWPDLGIADHGFSLLKCIFFIWGLQFLGDKRLYIPGLKHLEAIRDCPGHAHAPVYVITSSRQVGKYTPIFDLPYSFRPFIFISYPFHGSSLFFSLSMSFPLFFPPFFLGLTDVLHDPKHSAALATHKALDLMGGAHLGNWGAVPVVVEDPIRITCDHLNLSCLAWKPYSSHPGCCWIFLSVTFFGAKWNHGISIWFYPHYYLSI